MEKLYTVGSKDIYDKLLNRKDSIVYKTGGSDEYEGGIVFTAPQYAAEYAKLYSNIHSCVYEIYFVICTLENTYIVNGNYHLIKDAILEKLNKNANTQTTNRAN